jgi:acyl-CoA-binding protein
MAESNPELQRRFEQAARDVQALPGRPDNAVLLRLYGLYKQATAGDNTGPKPGFFDVVGNAKHEAWAQLHDMDRAEAMQRYVDLVERLRG